MQAGKQNDLMVSESGEGTSEPRETSGQNSWNVIASRNFGSTELMSCQNLDI